MFRALAAVSAAALLAGVAQAQDAAVAPEADASTAVSPSAFSDAQLTSFNGAMTRMSSVAEAVAGGTPSAEQQAEMAAAVEASGLGIEQFNAISVAVSADPVLRARLAVLGAPMPAAGSVSAAVTDAEVTQFSNVMVKMRELAPAAGSAPTAEQQSEMAAAVQASGLAVDRFNAIAQAVSQDARLRARVELADAERAGS